MFFDNGRGDQEAAFLYHARDFGHNYVADPLFTDRDNDDYTLQPASPAIGAGVGLR